MFENVDDNKKPSSLVSNYASNYLGQNSKTITLRDTEVININSKNLLNNNNNNILKRDKTEKTIFTSIISNGDNLNINSNSINNNERLSNINNNAAVNLNQNSVIRNSSSNKNLIVGLKNGKISTISSALTNIKLQKTQLTKQQAVNSALRFEKPSQALNAKLSEKKRNYSDNNPQQQINQNEINANNYNNKNNNYNNKNSFIKTINFNNRYSFIEPKPSKNLSPKNILDVFNSNKIKNNSNKESLNSANLNTHINSNSNGNSISSNPFQKNPLSVSLSDAKHSTFNKNARLNPSGGTLIENINNGKISSGKDLKIVNAVKLSGSKGEFF